MAFKLFDNEQSILCICDNCGFETDMIYNGMLQPVRWTLRYCGWRFQNGKTYCKECAEKIKLDKNI